jgi:AcrR family transcriptional regulator
VSDAAVKPRTEVVEGADRPARIRNPRGEGARLREEIIVGATALLERTGSEESLSLRAIAREIGVTGPAIVRHFDDLTQIIDVVIAREVEAFHDALATAGGEAPVERLLNISRAYVRMARDHPARYRVLIGRRMIEDWDVRNLAMEHTAPMLAATMGIVAGAIQACIDVGAAAGPDAYLDTVVLWFTLHGLVAIPQAITSIEWPETDRLLRACVTRAAKLIPPE